MIKAKGSRYWSYDAYFLSFDNSPSYPSMLSQSLTTMSSRERVVYSEQAFFGCMQLR
jgi:hypothetical protein